MVSTDTFIDIFDRVAIEIVGPLTTLENGNRYISTMQDDLSKFCLAAPMKQINAKAVARTFVDHFITRFGCLKATLTDQSTGFTSTSMRHVAKYFGIKQIKTTSFHLQSNGALECSHQVLTDYLKHYVSKND